ncbi:MAG: PD-(D/E)XK nuclease family protein [Actinobacteria bacterium]|nr:PD-(D/E)XK nuclease family protein [Actinomycetota bacterium]
MTFEIRPYPEFGWSMSRQRKLDQCPRGYYYAYYLHWNGWLDDAPTEARVAYRLGKLTSLDALLGQEVDERGRELEAAARAGEAMPAPHDLEQRTRAALRRAWAASQNGRSAFEQRPNRVVMLRSLYLGQDPQPETDRLNEKVGPSMHGLLATSHWRRLHGRGDEGRVEIPAFAGFMWDGVKVFAAPDLAYVADGTLHVIDWKTGREDDTQPVQVLLQLWWALETYPELARAAAEGSLDIRGHLEYVTAGVTQPVEPPTPPAAPDGGVAPTTLDDLRDACAGTVRAGIAQMRALLADPERNVPLPKDAFERRESGLCATCNFGPICA